MKMLMAAVCIVGALCAPGMGAVAISCADIGSQKFTVAYAYTGTESFPRAFALDITTNVGTIGGVTAAKTGESTSASKGFGIFPGTIVIDSAAGTVTHIGTPVAPQSDLPSGTLGGIGTSGVTVELGSLYADASGKPDASGLLVTVAVSGTVSNTWVSIVGNMARGGVVLEDGTSMPVTATCVLAYLPPPDCFYWPVGRSINPTKFDRWTACGKPACWCPPTFVTGLTAGSSGYQCMGDADGAKAPITNIRVGGPDVMKLAASWNKKPGQSGYNVCADIDHAPAPITNIGVGGNDLDRLIQNWNNLDAQLNTKLKVGAGGGYCGQATVPASYQ